MMAGQVIFKERYRLDEHLGQGGTALVHKATDLQTQQVCVVKELNIGNVEELKEIELFEREIQVLAALDHPRIPKLYDHFSIEGDGQVRLFLVQELVEGHDLQTLVERGHRFTTDQILNIGFQIISVLIYLHQRRPPLIHRDIKPSNVMLRADGQVFVIDFGAVRDRIKDSKVGGSTVVGTFGYMAPEQFRGHAEPATDVYALGATLLFLLTGRDPSDFEQKMLRLDIRSDAQLTPEMAELLEAMLEPASEVRASYMPQLVRAFKRVARGGNPFLPSEHPNAGANASGKTAQVSAELPAQVQQILIPEIQAMTDDLRDLLVGVERTKLAHKQAKEAVSFIDWLNVFHDSAEEVQAKTLKTELKGLRARKAAARQAWRDAILERALLNPLFTMATDFQRVLETLHQINTDSGEYGSRPTCRVYNLGGVYEALGEVDAKFREYTGVSRTFKDLDARIHQATVEPDVDTARRQLQGLEVLELGIVERAVAQLRASPYPKLFYKVKQLEKTYKTTRKKKKKADEAVGLWDRINIFSDSPEEMRLHAIAGQLGGIWKQLEQARGQMRECYHQAIGAEPVMNALFDIGEAHHSVSLIKAKATSHTRTEWDDNGNTYQETYYTCTLRGVSTAVARAREAERSVWEVLERPLGLEEIEQVILEQT